ncbi:MAG: formate dehydrogenase subunit gamma [Burkholderiales bacterium]
MRDNRGRRWVVRMLALVWLALLPQFAFAADSAKEQAERQLTQPLNNAPVWRDVRRGENPYQTTQVRGIETNILVQPAGETWRQIRNGPVTVYGGWLLVAVFLALSVFYYAKGPVKLHEKPTGRVIERFNTWERMVHWTTAISFCVMAVTGLIILFGRYVLLPVFGYTLFSWLATFSKNLHNFIGPLFVVCTVLIFVTFVRDNAPRAYDWLWVRKAGGLFSGEHVPSGRFNAGEKIWFWFGVALLGIVMSVTGLIMDFPNFAQQRSTMQLTNIVHAVGAILFMVMAFGHIYLGTVGVEGAYQTMRSGFTDETWAKEHHEYWYNEMMSRRQGAPGGAPSTAAASNLKEGWKL